MQLDFSTLQQYTPCYVYDGVQIIAQCKKLKTELVGFSFLYSAKANPFAPIVKAIAHEGFGVDAASAAEVFLARENGVLPSAILYSSPGKTNADLERTFDDCVLIADSMSEIERINALATAKGVIAQIGVRINPAFTMDGSAPLPSKFGIDIEQIDALEHCLRNCSAVRCIGVHIHIQTQVLCAKTMARYYKNCFALVKRLHACGICEVKFINFGSGIGAVYDASCEQPIALTELRTLIDAIVAENAKTFGATLYIETGRFPVCNAGTYYTEVIDVKESRGKTYAIVQNAMNGFFRPSVSALLQKNTQNQVKSGQEPLYTSEHAFQISVLEDSATSHKTAQRETMVSVVGNLCTALDVLAEDIVLPTLTAGDIIAVSNAGSYAYSLSPLLFSSHTFPKQLYQAVDGTVEIG